MKHYGSKPSTNAEREAMLYHFLGFARPEKIAEQTAQSLAERYGVKLIVAETAMQKMGRML